MSYKVDDFINIVLKEKKYVYLLKNINNIFLFM